MILSSLVRNYAKKKLKMPASLIAGGILVGAGLYGYCEYEKDHPELAYYTLKSKGKTDRDIRLVFLSDLHEKEFGEGNARLLEMIDQARPDMVLIGGDMIIGMKNRKNRDRVTVTLALCRELSRKYPVYYGNGNHEPRLADDSFRRELESYGVRYLSNERADLESGISITGIDLDRDQYLPVKPEKPDEKTMEKKIGRPDRKRFNILLAHSPLFLDSYEKTGVDLVLSGHFHGGTIRIGEKVGLMTPQYQFFSNKVVGMSQNNACFMIISAGLGTHSVNLRVNDKPQVVVVDIKK